VWLQLVFNVTYKLTPYDNIEPAPAHEMRRNPPVLINDWPEPGSEHNSEPEDPIEEPADGPDQDPPYEPGEADGNPVNEHAIPDAELRANMARELGDLAEAEWEELRKSFISCLARLHSPLTFLCRERLSPA
jgi:hypothetical protein